MIKRFHSSELLLKLYELVHPNGVKPTEPEEGVDPKAAETAEAEALARVESEAEVLSERLRAERL